MELNLNERRALITGGSRGLGRAMAETFARAGADVVIVGRDEQALGDTTSALEQIRPSGQFLGISADIANPGEIAELHHKAESFFGSVEILVNNAGTSNAKPFLTNILERLSFLTKHSPSLRLYLSGFFSISQETLLFPIILIKNSLDNIPQRIMTSFFKHFCSFRIHLFPVAKKQ